MSLSITPPFGLGPVIAPTLVNGWVNFGAGYANAGYYKTAQDELVCEGHIKSGLAGTVAFNRPTGFRSTLIRVFTNSFGGGGTRFGEVEFGVNGNVVPYGPADPQAFVTLNARFRVDS